MDNSYWQPLGWCGPIIQIATEQIKRTKQVKNPKWQDADQLSGNKRSQGVELEQISCRSVRDLTSGLPNFKSSAPTSWPCCLRWDVFITKLMTSYKWISKATVWHTPWWPFPRRNQAPLQALYDSLHHCHGSPYDVKPQTVIMIIITIIIIIIIVMIANKEPCTSNTTAWENSIPFP